MAVDKVAVESERFEKIVRMLKFYADLNYYSLIDRLAYAISPTSVEMAITDALRTLRSLWYSAKLVKDESTDEEKRCCYYEVVEESEECKIGFRVKNYCCLPCPPIPSHEEVEAFLSAVRRDISVAHKTAALALAWYPKKEKEE